MTLSNRIRMLRERASMTQHELSRKVGVSVVTIRNWESAAKKPSLDALVSLSHVFGVSVDDILGIENNGFDELSLTTDELRLLFDYRLLDRLGKQIVSSVCSLEKKRGDFKTSTKGKKSDTRRYIPLYSTPSAAGASFPLENDEFEMIPFDNGIPETANFAVRIQGDSMLPYISDGDIVYVEKNAPMNIGDVGIFDVDGAMYCKQYYIDSSRNLSLISSNPLLKETNVYIGADSNISVRCLGRVILEKKISTPDYFVCGE